MSDDKTQSNRVITHTVVGRVITFKVRDAGTLTLDMGNVSSDVFERAAIHGLVQRVSDAAAMSRDTTTGLAATPQAKFDAMAELVQHYSAGSTEWTLPGRARGGAGNEGGLLFRALMRLSAGAKTEEEIKAFVKARSKAEQNALLMSARVKPIVDEIRAESVGTIDAEELLAAL